MPTLTLPAGASYAMQQKLDVILNSSGQVIGYSTFAGDVFTPLLSTDSVGNQKGMLLPNATVRYNPIQLAQSAIPVICVPSGTVATNGTITLGTALQATYAAAWIILPAGAVVGGLAGAYYCEFSSSTVGVVRTTYVDPSTTAFTPYIPSPLVTATGSNAGYVATPTVDLPMLNVSIPAGLMGATGVIQMSFLLSTSNSGNAKIVKSSFGALAVLSSSTTTTLGQWVTREVANVTAAKQVTSPIATLVPGTSAAIVRGTVDTASAVTIALTGQLHTTDAGVGHIALEAFNFQILPGA